LDPLPLGIDPTRDFKNHLKEVCAKNKITRERLADIARIDPSKLIEGKESLSEIHLIHLLRITKLLVLVLKIEEPDGCEPRTLTEHESVLSVLSCGRRIRFVEPEKISRE
jgi:hypothetical protein